MAFPIRKIAFWTAGIAAIGAGIYFSFQTQPVPVDLATVSSGPMEVTIDADGVSRIRNVFEVFAPVTGKLHRSPVAVGDAVVAGQTLVAVIEPTQPAFLDARSRLQAEAAVKEAEAALRNSEANIGRAEADYEYARDQFDRANTLFEGGTVTLNKLNETKLLLEQSRTALVLALSERSLRQSTLDRTKAMLVGPAANGSQTPDSCCIKIFAPVDGTILSVASTSEHIVGVGAPIVSIGRPDDLELVVDLLSSDVVRIAQGAFAYVERWGGNKTLAARVRRIEPSAFTKLSALGISEQRVHVVLDIDSPMEERRGLGDGFRVFVRIVEWQGDSVVQLPISALFRTGDNWTVFRAEDGLAKETVVRIGARNALTAEVLGGLSNGDIVITHPSDRVSNGVQIIDREEL